jgi:hypothetical protein
MNAIGCPRSTATVHPKSVAQRAVTDTGRRKCSVTPGTVRTTRAGSAAVIRKRNRRSSQPPFMQHSHRNSV